MTAELNKPALDAAAAPASTRHPLGFWFFFWGEFAERCSFYGMKTILPFYLKDALLFNQNDSSSILNAFKMGAYFLPLVGGFLADRFFGKYWTIVGFSLPYVLGHFILGIPATWALVIALVLLAGGSGVIKPNISTLMGLTYDQKRPGQEQLRSAAFLWFYFAINVGAFLSTAALPSLQEYFSGKDPSAQVLQHSYALTFQVPAWLMVAALIVFAAGKPFYATETLKYAPPTAEERAARRQTLGRLAGIFGLIVFFWVGYELNDNVWLFFVEDHVRLDNLHVWGLPDHIPPAQLQVINPLCVIIFAPLFAWLFRKLDPQARIFTVSNKMIAGFAMGVISNGLMAAAAYLVEGTDAKVSLAWPSAAFVFLTIGEILIYGTGLELAYAAAPKNIKGFVTACFLLTNTLADFINIGFTQLYRQSLAPGNFFAVAALIVLAAGIVFFFVAGRFEQRTHASGYASGE